MADGFAAEPGTVAGRDEFRGTGGSLYFLRRQDVLEGSERVRIEIRDKDSGMVLGVKNLTPVLDYDIDYLQGRLLLTAAPGLDGGRRPAGAQRLDRRQSRFSWWSVTNSPPGVDDLDDHGDGGRVHYWFNDHVKVGVTASRDEEAGSENTLGGADVTVRKSAESWIKLEAGRSEGPGARHRRPPLDGGFNFGTPSIPWTAPTSKARAYRADCQRRPAGLLRQWAGPVHLLHPGTRCGLFGPGPGHRPGHHPVRRHGGAAAYRTGESAAQGRQAGCSARGSEDRRPAS